MSVRDTVKCVPFQTPFYADTSPTKLVVTLALRSQCDNMSTVTCATGRAAW
jgi:hypothetical protein